MEMDVLLKKREIIYKGIHYTDVIANNIEKGGELLDFTLSGDDQEMKYEITTSYAGGLTVVTDELVYRNDLLHLWKIVLDNQKTYLIFSREEYDYYLNILRKDDVN